MLQNNLEHAYLNTPLGTTIIKGNSEGITEIKVLDDRSNNTTDIPDSLKEAVNQLQLYFSKDLKQFNLKLNPHGTDFQKKVWNGLMEIPYGKITSYLQLSKNLGDAKAIRAVAAANAKNPLWIVVPCHRIIGSNGSLTGYAGGLHRKKWLIEHESPSPQQKLF